MVGEEVLIGGVEGGAAGVVQAVGADLNRGGGICGVFSQMLEGGIENVGLLSSLPLALIVLKSTHFLGYCRGGLRR